MDIDEVIDKKISMLDAHVSQMYEWLPWHAGTLAQVPVDPVARKAWLKNQRATQPNAAVREALVKWYGSEAAKQIKYAEAFEICEYGAKPSPEDIRRLFPFYPAVPK